MAERREGSQNTAPASTPRRLKKRLGQISILVVFSLVPMFTLFAFSVNIGMMVNAKIALQNATDFAAYAGAATQARQLTDISHLNYYMRMIYKKFLYKYYVLGNVSLRCFPGRADTMGKPICSGNGSGPSPFKWINPLTSLAGGGGAVSGAGNFPGVPVVCISLNPNSNPCQVGQAVHVVTSPPCNPADPTCLNLQAASNNIAAVQHAACLKSSAVNQKVLGLWLYATDFEAQNPGVSQLTGMVNNDIGIITEEELTLQRILNLKEAINTPPKPVVTSLSQAQTFLASGDVANSERTVLAYATLMNGINTAGDSPVFDPSTVSMTELLPATGSLVLKNAQVSFDAGIAFLSTDPTNIADPCHLRVGAYTATGSSGGGGMNIGVYKDPGAAKVVYYAIKTEAKAKLLFNPFPFGQPADSITFTAYAAAMPFGSRIGPVLEAPNKTPQDEFTVTGTPKDGDGSTPMTPPGASMAYPALTMDSRNSITTESFQFLNDVYSAIFQRQPGSNITLTASSPTIMTNNMAILMHIATLPDVDEVGRYNIPVDAERYTDSGSTRTFLPYYVSTSGVPSGSFGYTFWAPFQSQRPGGAQAFTNEMGTLISNLMSNAQNGAAAAGLSASINQIMAELQAEAQAGLSSGTGGLFGPNQLGSQNSEGLNVFRMIDPLSQNFWPGNGGIPRIAGKATNGCSPNPIDPVACGRLMTTSFVTQNDSKYAANGRDGYSVKLVSFKELMSGGVRNETGGTWNTSLPGSDMTFLQH